ncbi:YkvA family protein [Pelolinea submarina]|uniref:Uncharacterized membrane protein YkvA (DUF1232 family) n=1 Tax=Pelolinea submarina TaxID=913107 RepID=A0A347ZTZ6_9CHLR|nr:YkvA family protein [Pelolinea submarina]REG10639.1 uncharacterized membrane protein YkvA (DUF1232 family) [Pelolinea submarina]BBB48777.1 hypothetical protein Pelsub_P2008 [Pelolinea submarina]
MKFEKWKEKAKTLKREVYTLYLAYKDPRVPWYAKVFSAFVVGYAFSPIDLIPDFIPVLGYLDDLILVPLGVALAIKMIPVNVLAECREKSDEVLQQGKPVNRSAAVIIVILWIAIIAWMVKLGIGYFSER